MPTPPNQSVKIRRVFYIPGYDPHPPRRYRELYRVESAKQGDISGYSVAVENVKARQDVWATTARMDGAQVRTGFEVLEWHDIVQDTMDRSIVGTYAQLVQVAFAYLATGTLRRLTWLRVGPILAGFYPVLMLLGQLLLAMIAGKVAAGVVTGTLSLGVGATVGLVIDNPTDGIVWGWIDWLIGWAVFAAVLVPILRWFKAKDRNLFAYYLMHDLAYTVQRNGAYPEELDERISQFARRIAAALASPADEVVIVGHSSGAQLAVSAVARLVRDEMLPANGPALSLLTLGQAIPMVSFLPKADVLRRDLHDLAAEDRITWVDVSAPGDGCSFALCDPVSVTGVAPEGQRWPLVLSAAYSKTLSPDRWAELKGKYFRLHFQYLCAFDRPGDYDYFRITAGPITLGERFAGRKPSMNRIDVPASRFRSMAA